MSFRPKDRINSAANDVAAVSSDKISKLIVKLHDQQFISFVTSHNILEGAIENIVSPCHFQFRDGCHREEIGRWVCEHYFDFI